MKKIALTQGKFAIVDDDDYEWLNQWKWCAAKDGDTYYAVRHSPKSGKLIRMHREVMQALPGMQIHHKNHNGLDNRKSNLELCDTAQNQWNQRRISEKQVGVSWHKQIKRWVARIRHRGRRINVGTFQTKEEATKAYKKAEKKLRGQG